MNTYATCKKLTFTNILVLLFWFYAGNASATICGGVPCVDSADIINGTVSASDLTSSAKAAVKSDAGATPWTAVPTAAANLRSITVTSPSTAGRFIVTATGTVSYGHNSGTEGYICLDLSNVNAYTGGCTPMAGSASAIRSFIPAGFPTFTNDYGMPYTIIESFPVTATGAYTFYLNGNATGLTSVYLFHPTFTVQFVPRTLP